MGNTLRSGSTAGLLIGIGVALVLGLGASSARADDAIKTASPASVAASKSVLHPHKKTAARRASARRSVPHRYFVEFRARNAASYGHMYVMYGQVNGRDEIVDSHIAGFFPAGDKRDCVNCSVVNWTVGHLIFVPGEMGVSDGDLEEKYVLARYRVWVSRAEYQKVKAFIKEREDHVPQWNALWKNCVDFGRDVAEFMNLKVPLFIWMEPKDFIHALAFANGVKHKQLPLKDAANSLRTSVHAASQKPSLPPRRPKTERTSGVHPSLATKPAQAKKRPVTGHAHEKPEAVASRAAAR